MRPNCSGTYTKNKITATAVYCIHTYIYIYYKVYKIRQNCSHIINELIVHSFFIYTKNDCNSNLLYTYIYLYIYIYIHRYRVGSVHCSKWLIWSIYCIVVHRLTEVQSMTFAELGDSVLGGKSAKCSAKCSS